MHTTIIRPLVTEKSMNKVSDGRYSFAVAQYATKTDVKNVIEKTFNVKVVSISSSVVKGKSRRAGARRLEIADSVWKKVTVTVKKGDKIYLFETGSGEEVKEPKKEKKVKKEATEKKEVKK